MERCLTGLEDKVFECYVDTEQISIPGVAGIIMSLLETEEWKREICNGGSD
jgi:hypothetical protein